MENLIKVMKALSDETRLRILNVLLERECCVCEVMQALDISQSRASRNLGILQDAGFLKARRDGAWMYYAVNGEAVDSGVASFVGVLKNLFASNQALAGDRERLWRLVGVGQGCR